MASKLRNRTPLFGYDGNLGIPIIPSSASSSAAAAAARAGKGSPYQVSERAIRRKNHTATK